MENSAKQKIEKLRKGGKSEFWIWGDKVYRKEIEYQNLNLLVLPSEYRNELASGTPDLIQHFSL